MPGQACDIREASPEGRWGTTRIPTKTSHTLSKNSCTRRGIRTRESNKSWIQFACHRNYERIGHQEHPHLWYRNFQGHLVTMMLSCLVGRLRCSRSWFTRMPKARDKSILCQCPQERTIKNVTSFMGLPETTGKLFRPRLRRKPYSWSWKSLSWRMRTLSITLGTSTMRRERLRTIQCIGSLLSVQLIWRWWIDPYLRSRISQGMLWQTQITCQLRSMLKREHQPSLATCPLLTSEMACSLKILNNKSTTQCFSIRPLSSPSNLEISIL